MKKILVVRHAPRDEKGYQDTIGSKGVYLAQELGEKIRKEFGGVCVKFFTQTREKRFLDNLTRQIAMAARIEIGEEIPNLKMGEFPESDEKTLPVVVTHLELLYMLYACPMEKIKYVTAFIVEIDEEDHRVASIFFEGGE